MATCWAARLGGCSTKMSGEHIVSSAVFTGRTVRVKGLPWCRLDYKEIGRAALTSNILCTAHNRLLSPTDREAGRLFDSMRERASISHRRVSEGKPPWPLAKYRVDGKLIERWLVKTTINIYHQAPEGWTWHESEDFGRSPPDKFVGVAFGQGQLDKPYGLYVWAKIGDTIRGVAGLSFSSLHDEQNGLVGAYFETIGIRLLIWLSSLTPPNDAMRRAKRIEFNDLSQPSQRLTLDW